MRRSKFTLVFSRDDIRVLRGALMVFLFRVINDILSKVDKHIEQGNLVSGLNMSALPDLFDQVVKLIKCLVYLCTKSSFLKQVSMIFKITQCGLLLTVEK